MKVSKNVKLSGLKIEMKIVLETVEKIFLEFTGKESYITHTDDGIHSPASLHPYGYAIDYRIKHIPKEKPKMIVENIKKELPKGFDVILHKTHIHIEWDDAKKLIKIGKL